jgi:hypothetical protein
MFNLINLNKITKVNLKISVIALAIGMFAVSCSGGSKQQNGSATTETKTEQAATNATVVQIVSVDVNDFNSERGTARLHVTLDNPVAGLMMRNVTVNVGEVGLVQCSSGDPKYWRVDIEGLPKTTPQEITVTIQKNGFTIEPKSKKVTLN